MKLIKLAALAVCITVFAAVAVNAAPIRQSDAGHDGSSVPATKKMKVSVKVRKDKMKGYNLFVKTRGFRWAPEHASGKHRKGEGHAHLMIDGKKVTRLYGSAYYLSELASGSHKVVVTLNANDHRGYTRNGREIKASTTVVVR